MIRPPTRLRDTRGFALLAVCVLLLVMLTIGAASTLYTTMDLRGTSHYDTGNRAFAAAEAGVLHALSVINASSVGDFQRDVVTRWPQLYGTDAKSLPSLPSLRYTVTVTPDPANPGGRGVLTATGYAPLGAQRSIAVTLEREGFAGAPGAIYLAADSVSSQFSGNAFEVDGNDHNMFGDLVPTGPVKPGIATRNDGVSSAVANSLRSKQKDNVRGLGFSLNPLTPSVMPTGGPSVSDLDALVARLLTLPGVVTTSEKQYTGNATFGTPGAPQVTHMTNKDVRLAGNASGAGILIADGSLTITGTLDFIGWIIVRGATVVNGESTEVLGNATILGSLWTGHLDIKVGGSAIIDYCHACMQLVESLDAGSGALPRRMRPVAWQEIL